MVIEDNQDDVVIEDNQDDVVIEDNQDDVVIEDNQDDVGGSSFFSSNSDGNDEGGSSFFSSNSDDDGGSFFSSNSDGNDDGGSLFSSNDGMLGGYRNKIYTKKKRKLAKKKSKKYMLYGGDDSIPNRDTCMDILKYIGNDIYHNIIQYIEQHKHLDELCKYLIDKKTDIIDKPNTKMDLKKEFITTFYTKKTIPKYPNHSEPEEIVYVLKMIKETDNDNFTKEYDKFKTTINQHLSTLEETIKLFSDHSNSVIFEILRNKIYNIEIKKEENKDFKNKFQYLMKYINLFNTIPSKMIEQYKIKDDITKELQDMEKVIETNIDINESVKILNENKNNKLLNTTFNYPVNKINKQFIVPLLLINMKKINDIPGLDKDFNSIKKNFQSLNDLINDDLRDTMFEKIMIIFDNFIKKNLSITNIDNDLNQLKTDIKILKESTFDGKFNGFNKLIILLNLIQINHFITTIENKTDKDTDTFNKLFKELFELYKDEFKDTFDTTIKGILDKLDKMSNLKNNSSLKSILDICQTYKDNTFYGTKFKEIYYKLLLQKINNNIESLETITINKETIITDLRKLCDTKNNSLKTDLDKITNTMYNLYIKANINTRNKVKDMITNILNTIKNDTSLDENEALKSIINNIITKMEEYDAQNDT